MAGDSQAISGYEVYNSGHQQRSGSETFRDKLHE